MNSGCAFVYVIVSEVDPQHHYVGLTSDVTTRLAFTTQAARNTPRSIARGG